MLSSFPVSLFERFRKVYDMRESFCKVETLDPSTKFEGLCEQSLCELSPQMPLSITICQCSLAKILKSFVLLKSQILSKFYSLKPFLSSTFCPDEVKILLQSLSFDAQFFLLFCNSNPCV